MKRSSNPIIVRTLALALTCASIFAYASWDGIVESVHFYGWPYGEDEIDLGRVPVELRVKSWTNEPERSAIFSTAGFYGDTDEDEDMVNSYVWFRHDSGDARDKKLAKARNEEARGHYKLAMELYCQVGSSTRWRSFIQDRREVIDQLHKSKDKRGVAEYLKARYITEPDITSWAYPPKYTQPGKKLLQTLEARKTVAPWLRPHIAYAIASIGNDNVIGRSSYTAYAQIAKKFPNSPRWESAMIMSARALVNQNSKPSAKDVALAESTLRTLLSKRPNTRFKASAYGWLGRCAIYRGKPSEAIKLYMQQFDAATEPDNRWKALDSLAFMYSQQGQVGLEVEARLRQWALDGPYINRAKAGWQLQGFFEGLKTAQSAEVQKRIRSDQELLAAYIWYRIDATELSHTQEVNLLRFARSSVRNAKSLNGVTSARLAQIAYNTGNDKLAKTYAERAISSLPSRSLDRGRAMYVRAATLQHLKRYADAIGQYEQVVREYKDAIIGKSAREPLTLLYERHGDPVKAMDHYRALRYDLDVAYLADVYWTPEQLARYIATAKDKDFRNVLQYTLGARYMRTENYSQARAAFRKLTRSERMRFGMPKKRFTERSKDGFGYDDLPKPFDPIDVANDLERLTKLSVSAKSANQRAQALYDKAAYIYKRRNLLFYSAGLWEGSRAFAFDALYNDTINLSKDDNRVRKHYYEHECLAQSMRLCDEILAKYPKATITPKALYTCGLATERLSNLNVWWRDEADKKRFLMKASNRMSRLVKQFPNDPLAKNAAKYAKEFATAYQERLSLQSEVER